MATTGPGDLRLRKRRRARCAFRKLARMASQRSRPALARSTSASRRYPMGTDRTLTVTITIDEAAVRVGIRHA